MKIVYVSEFFSEDMGYTENCLPKALALLGHEVHVIASDFQVYGNDPDYENSYGRYLGHRCVPIGTNTHNGCRVHRLPHRLLFGYVDIAGLSGLIRLIRPDVIQTTSCISSALLHLVVGRRFLGYQLYSECHQHLSVVRPFLKKPGAHPIRKALYFLTRTLPGRFISLATDKCFAIAPDCAFVARRFYGVQAHKIALLPLGTETDRFFPAVTEDQWRDRQSMRVQYGISDAEILCIYTGRFSAQKNPLLLARAIEIVRAKGHAFRGLFVGEGEQKTSIESIEGNTVIPFRPYVELPGIYRMGDIGVWPTQESMSMLDAAASGLPVVVSDRIGEPDRIDGNGLLYREGDVAHLADILVGLRSPELRKALGQRGTTKMRERYSWQKIAGDLDAIYRKAATPPV